MNGKRARVAVKRAQKTRTYAWASEAGKHSVVSAVSLEESCACSLRFAWRDLNELAPDSIVFHIGQASNMREKGCT